jgi:hypothetical protein
MGRGRLTPAILLAVALLGTAAAGASAQSLALYDDFAADRIHPGKWHGFEYVTAYTRTRTLEGGWQNRAENEATSNPRLSVADGVAIREVVNGALRLALTSHGAASASGITPGVARLGTRMERGAGPGTLRSLQARVTVADAIVEPCGAEESRARAQIVAHFFRRDDADVVASLALQRTTFGGDRVIGVVSRCRDFSCTTAEDIDFVVFDRGWTPGVPHVLTITDQADRNRFLFTVGGGGTPAQSRAVVYPAVGSHEPPNLPFRDLRVENAPAFCPASGGAVTRARVTMDARFDTVKVAE